MIDHVINLRYRFTADIDRELVSRCWPFIFLFFPLHCNFSLGFDVISCEKLLESWSLNFATRENVTTFVWPYSPADISCDIQIFRYYLESRESAENLILFQAIMINLRARMFRLTLSKFRKIRGLCQKGPFSFIDEIDSFHSKYGTTAKIFSEPRSASQKHFPWSTPE